MRKSAIITACVFVIFGVAIAFSSESLSWSDDYDFALVNNELPENPGSTPPPSGGRFAAPQSGTSPTFVHKEQQGVFSDFSSFSISPQSGSYSETIRDLVLPGINGSSFSITRRYDPNTAKSDSGKSADSDYSYYPETAYNVGSGWRLNIPYFTIPKNYTYTTIGVFEDVVGIVLPSGATYRIKELEYIEGTSPRVYMNNKEVHFRIIVNPSQGEYELIMSDGTTYEINSKGLVTSIYGFSNGHKTAKVSINNQNQRIYYIEDNFGRRINFVYTLLNNIHTITSIDVTRESGPGDYDRSISYTHSTDGQRLLKEALIEGGESPDQVSKQWLYDYTPTTLSNSESDDMTFEYLSQITSPTGSRSILSGTHKERFYKKKGEADEEWADRLLVTQLQEYVQTRNPNDNMAEEHTLTVDYSYTKSLWEGNEEQPGTLDEFISYVRERETNIQSGQIRLVKHSYSPGTEIDYEGEASTFTSLVWKKTYDEDEGNPCLEYEAYGYAEENRLVDSIIKTVSPSSSNTTEISYIFDEWGNVIRDNRISIIGERVSQRTIWTQYWGTEYTIGSTGDDVSGWKDDPYDTNGESRISYPDDYRSPSNLPILSISLNYYPEPVEASYAWSGMLYTHHAYDYDEAGQTIGSTVYSEQESNWLNTTYEYDDQNRPIEIEQPGGLTTSFSFSSIDPVNSPYYIITETITDPDDTLDWENQSNMITRKTGISIDLGKTLWTMCGRGYVTEYDYDAWGRVVSIVAPDVNGSDDIPFVVPGDSAYNSSLRNNNPEFVSEYDDAQLKVQTEDPMGRITTTYYNSSNLPVLKVHETPNIADYSEVEERFMYDGWNQLVSYTAPPNGVMGSFTYSPTTELFYDVLGRNTRVVQPDGEVVTFEYDDEPQITTITNERGFKTENFYDLEGNLIKAIEDDNGVSRELENYHDGYGNLWFSIDAKGQETIYEYNELGQLIEIQSPLDPANPFFYDGQIDSSNQMPFVRYEYNVDGFKIKESTSKNSGGEHETTYSVDGLGRIYQVNVPYTVPNTTLTVDAVTQIQYDANGNSIKVIDANNSGLTEPEYGEYMYSPYGGVIEQIDPEGNKIQFTYYDDGKISTETDPRGMSGNYPGIDFTTTYEYDDLGRLKTKELPLYSDGESSSHPKIEYDYYPGGNIATEISPDGTSVEYQYTSRDQVSIIAVHGGGKIYETRYEYDEVGNAIQVTNPNEATISSEYDGWNRVVKVIKPLGEYYRYEYDNNDNLIAEIDGNANRTAHDYNSINQRISTTLAENSLNLEYEYKYDRRGNLTRSVDPEGRIIDIDYDERGLCIEKNEFGFNRDYEYDHVGNLIYSITSDGTISSYTYDANNRPTEIVVGNGTENISINHEYDEAGYKIRMNEGGVTTEYNVIGSDYYPDPFGRINTENTLLDGKSFTVNYDYDISGRVTGITGPSGYRLESIYNQIGELIRMPGIIDSDILYDNTGRRENAQLANGVNLDWQYDLSGRLVSKEYKTSLAQVKAWTFQYDQNDNIIAMNERLYGYDGVNQMLYEQREETMGQPLSLDLSLLYDDVLAAENFVTFPLTNEMIELDYNAGSLGVDFGGIININKVILSPDSPVHRIDRYSLKILSSIDDTEGSYEDTSSWYLDKNDDGSLEIVFSDSLVARFLKIHCTFNDRDYDYHPVNQSSFQNTADQIIAVYTSSQVISRDDMTYDGIGNRTMEYLVNDGQSASYYSEFYQHTKRLKSNGQSGLNGRYGYHYDLAGNLVAKGEVYSEPTTDNIVIDETLGDRWEYQWDLLNRLSDVSNDGVGVSSYRYSPRGLQVKKTGVDTTYFIYDLWGNVIYEESGGDYRDYVYAFGKHLVRIDGIVDGQGVHTESDRYFYHSNHIGTVEGVTDENGNLMWEASYTAFGEIISTTGTLDQDPIFGGKTYDGDAELYYFNARWYDPTTGSFISEDPARDGVNWYSYVGNNPLKYIDPTGLMQIEGTEKEDSDVTQEKERKRRAREKRKRDRDKKPNRPSEAELQAQRELEWQRQMDEWEDSDELSVIDTLGPGPFDPLVSEPPVYDSWDPTNPYSPYVPIDPGLVDPLDPNYPGLDPNTHDDNFFKRQKAYGWLVVTGGAATFLSGCGSGLAESMYPGEVSIRTALKVIGGLKAIGIGSAMIAAAKDEKEFELNLGPLTP